MKKIILIFVAISFSLSFFGQTKETKQSTINNNQKSNKMKIEIWSDVMCPFCYIGKRKFETALEQFADKDNIEIEWKSFQLMPELETQPDVSLNQFFAEAKGLPIEQAKQMNDRVALMAKQIGLEYNLDKAIPANSFKAHRFIHFAKANGKQNEAEEILFQSYFTDGKNIDDNNTLLALGKELGLDNDALQKVLENETYADEVRADILEAHQIGVRGVPFFVFDRKQAISGAQEPQAFLQTLENTFAEWRKENPETKLEIINGEACTPDGKCE